MKRIHDLTLTYEEGMRGVSFEQAKDLEKDGWNAKTLHLYSHAGTHMDAPVHFGVSGPTIDQFEPNELMLKAWIADVTSVGSSGLIRVADLGSIADQLVKGDVLILKSGWSKMVGQDTYRDQLPRISEELAVWCNDQGVRMIGVEPPSVADVNNLEEVTRIHYLLLGAGIIIVEGLTNLDAITSSYVTLIALPLKIKDGDGAPARVIAIEEEP